MNTDLERKFLHDIASPISICRLTIGLILEELAEEADSEYQKKMKLRLDKIASSLEKIEALHATHKENIFNLEKA